MPCGRARGADRADTSGPLMAFCGASFAVSAVSIPRRLTTKNSACAVPRKCHRDGASERHLRGRQRTLAPRPRVRSICSASRGRENIREGPPVVVPPELLSKRCSL